MDFSPKIFLWFDDGGEQETGRYSTDGAQVMKETSVVRLVGRAMRA